MLQQRVRELLAKTYQDRQSTGLAAAQDIAAELNKILQQKEQVRMILHPLSGQGVSTG